MEERNVFKIKDVDDDDLVTMDAGIKRCSIHSQVFVDGTGIGPSANKRVQTV